MLSRIGLGLGRRSRRLALGATALIFAAIGAHSLNPRELYHQMYPLEPVKQDAFHICDESDPTFIRAISSEREACYDKMPHVMAIAMGRVKPGGALSLEALTDPAREAKLLMLLATTPPQQPITEPRSFSNTAWMRALKPPCDAKPVLPTASTGAIPLPGGVSRGALSLVPLSPNRRTAPSPDIGGKLSGLDSMPAPDIGDVAPPAIVPLAPSIACSGV